MTETVVDKRISIGTIVATIGLLVSLLGVAATFIQIGVWRGVMEAEMAAIKIQMAQVQSDSRALVQLQAEVTHIRKAVDELRGR